VYRLIVFSPFVLQFVLQGVLQCVLQGVLQCVLQCVYRLIVFSPIFCTCVREVLQRSDVLQCVLHAYV